MGSVCRHIIYVLLCAFSMSSVASSIVPCVTDLGQAPNQESIVDIAHEGHMTGHHDFASQKDDSISDDCSCCDDCASMCPSVGGNLIAITSQNFIPSFSVSDQSRILPDLIHDSPTPNPLFRPPISVS